MLENTIWDSYMMILNDISLFRIIKTYMLGNTLAL